MSATVFYERAVALDRAAHQDTKIQIQPDHYAFARDTNALPIAASEFADAGRHYPIVFVGDEQGNFHVAVLLGLEDRSNLFVTAEGMWKADTYVPAFARRYPFVLGTTSDADRLAVCIDESYPGINSAEGVALFEDGKETGYLTQMMEFLRVFQGEMELTKQMAQRLNELGLLVAKTITISQTEGDRYLSGFWVVDDQKFAGIDDVRVVELHRSGILRLIELHRASLGNVPRLAMMLDEQRRQKALQQQEVASTTDAAPREAAA
ncbi:SapC family protein [Bordetella hinzii]|uniref:SapC family protein n=1 Tax=Bordetella hinzii TaxID=103855 RepID=A0AAN1VHH9_9BORD|nr:SapC family protein [Bordetella hinzii]AKQ55352.1 SapC [Bordetella hinzii]AKQ59853.1 SapC [Bordetella hinzii]AZW19034.1 SapC family protein [Bordetella hinzii]KCB30657.1 SapC [Bordetella hinzii L60]KCB43629.1 SapC [Bordetella hinzii 4161]